MYIGVDRRDNCVYYGANVGKSSRYSEGKVNKLIEVQILLVERRCKRAWEWIGEIINTVVMLSHL